MKLSIQAICNMGLVRTNNEDAISIGGYFLRDDSTSLTVTTLDDGWFYLLVSDGMGGHENGEEASQYTLEELGARMSDGISRENFEDDIRQTVHEISNKLNLWAAQRGQVHPMGCTLTGIVWHYGHTYLINAGDSRTYRFRDGILRQLTTDETERGLTGDPNASKYLLNCIGGGCEGRLVIDSMDDKLLDGDIILVCSDGLADMVSDDAIEAALNSGASAQDLLRMACEGGGADNISIILAGVSVA